MRFSFGSPGFDDADGNSLSGGSSHPTARLVGSFLSLFVLVLCLLAMVLVGAFSRRAKPQDDLKAADQESNSTPPPADSRV